MREGDAAKVVYLAETFTLPACATTENISGLVIDCQGTLGDTLIPMGQRKGAGCDGH